MKTMKKIFSFCFALFISFSLVPSISTASFLKELSPKWQVNNPLSTKTISHAEWQKFLDCCVITNKEGINLVNYPQLTTEQHALLNNYISQMAQVDIRKYNRNEQLAFWLNLYNALTVQTVAEYYPITNILEINTSPGLFSVGPWGASLININNTRLTLDEIHNRIIRPIWNDPRTHYAISNGTIGGANLHKKAFEGKTINSQLNEVARSYINSSRCTQVIEGRLVVSRIYEWFADDFGGNSDDLLLHLTEFAQEPLLSQLKHVSTINAYTYNWRLNSTLPVIS